MIKLPVAISTTQHCQIHRVNLSSRMSFAARGIMTISIQNDCDRRTMVTKVGAKSMSAPFRLPQIQRGHCQIRFAIEEMRRVERMGYDHLTWRDYMGRRHHGVL